MNKTINKFLLTRDKFMTELHLKQPRFTDSACEPFTKNIVKEFKYYQLIQNIYIEMNQRKLGFLIIQHILTVKVELRALFQKIS